MKLRTKNFGEFTVREALRGLGIALGFIIIFWFIMFVIFI